MIATPAEIAWSDWATEPLLLASVVVPAVLYARGAHVLARNSRHHSVKPSGMACFAAGWVVLAIALISPLHELSEQLFSAHMVQHELLMAVAAPLLVVGRPGPILLWAFPHSWRVASGRALRSRVWRSLWRAICRPFDAWLIHGVAIWGWHIPVLFRAAVHSETVHALQHLSFVGSALVFWWAVFHPRRKAELGISVILLFTTAVHTAVLGALISFARSPWYVSPATDAMPFGLTPLADQQLAGLIMWIPAGAAYLIAALLLMRRWLASSELTVARGERLPLVGAAR